MHGWAASASEAARLRLQATLQIAIDGKQIQLPPTQHPGRVLYAYVLDDAVAVELPLSATHGLSSDTKIDVTLGDYSYRLSGGNLNTLRSIAEKVW